MEMGDVVTIPPTLGVETAVPVGPPIPSPTEAHVLYKPEKMNV